MSKRLIGCYNYTVVLTYIGFIMGFIGISEAFSGDYHSSFVCLMIAGLCDMFDGTVASTKKDRTKDEKAFGVQIDSLSDLVCFGVLPATIVWSLREEENQFLVLIPALFVLCGLIRLAYYNVDEMNRQAKTADSRACYTGLPITASALLLPAIFEVCIYCDLPTFTVTLVSLVIIAIAYITPFHLTKIHLLGKILVIALGLVEFTVLLMGRVI